MKESTIKYIQKLTTNDTKTLSQKALKLSEETGEVAREILPFENAHGTTHRFGTKERILEECADTFLCDISIVFDLGFTYEEFVDMIETKMVKWAEVQNRHERAGFPIPYEIHITVKHVNQENFRQVCHALDVKPIVLALQVGQEELEDVMTSSKHFGDNQSAYLEMKRISDGLRRAEFEVVREKIETVPWHPGAPSVKNARYDMPQDCYFETHIGVNLPPSTPNATNALSGIADVHSAHLSRNAFKEFEDGSTVQMVTLRKYDGTYEQFQEQAKRLRDDITKFYKIDNVVTEFSVYDTKVSHDAAWINKQS